MKNIDFVAIDFEHSVPFKGSVCSVGIVSYKDGQIVDEYSTLIKPPNNEYNNFTIRVHGITPDLTEDAPTFSEIYPEIKNRINGNVVVAHNAFSTDKACLEQAMEHSGIDEVLDLNWQCTYRITNAKLNIVAKVCNIELNHHEALSDAKVCAEIFYMHQKNLLPLDKIAEESSKQKKVSKKYNKPSERLKGDVFKPDFENAENKTNPFYMKKVVVTGFASSTKKEIANELKSLGADVDSSVTKRTNYLIIGENAGPSKIKKMRSNIEEGKEASILNLETYDKIKQHAVNIKS